MSDPTASAGFDADLRRYLELCAAVEIPARVRAISARTRVAPRRRGGWVIAGTAAAAMCAVVATAVGIGHIGPIGGASRSFSVAESGIAAQVAPPSQVKVTYPGVTSAVLAGQGVVLLTPTGHGAPSVSPSGAQAAAQAASGGSVAVPGPAVLSFVSLSGPPSSCLCWAVAVPVSSTAGVGFHTEFVLVDAIDARIVRAFSVGTGQ